MGAVEILVMSLTSSLCLYFLLTLIRGLHKLWWTPIHMKNQLSSQGIKGPSYRFFHGSTKEIFNMRNEAMSRPMNLSHDIFPQFCLLFTHGLTNMVQESFKVRIIFNGLALKLNWFSIEVMLERWKHHEGKEIEAIDFISDFKDSFWEQLLRREEHFSDELVRGIHNPILEIIKKREEKVMTGEGSSFVGDFLQLLVEAHHDANASLKISIEDLVDECKTFYIAGQETTSTLLAWTIFLLIGKKGGAQFIWPTKSKSGWNHKTQDCKNVSNSNQLLSYKLSVPVLIWGLHKLWWTPIHVKNQLSSQGIKGPSYRFFHGSTKEILNMRKEAMSRPMNLSHDIFSTILPHVHSWIDKYGKNYLQWFGPKAQLVVTEPELIKEIMNNRDNAYPKPETANYTKKLLGDGLVTSEGEKWAKMRKLANSAFHAESLKKEKMGAVEILVISLTSSLCLYFLLTLIRGLHKLWWTPIHMKNQLSSQGIKGPSYRFFHGSTKEIFNMKKEAMSRPMNLSHDIFSTILPHVHSWVDKYGNNYLQWFGPKAQLVVTEPELIKEILNNRDNAYSKPEIGNYAKKLLGDGLVTSEGNMIPSMISSIEVMLERWKHHEGKEIEVCEEFRLLTSEVISRTAFGSSYLEGKNIFQMLMKLALISSRNAYKLRFPGISKIYKTNDEIESEELVKGIHNAILEIIKKREEKVMTGESIGGDFLQLLVEAHNDPNASQKISIEDLLDECKTFYIAGQETTSTLLGWTIFLLAIHTDWQEEARKEVLSLFGQQNPNPDGITKLKTTSMIINESLRLYPPAITITRKVEREVRLGKLTLPANLLLYITTLAPHHDPKIWGEDVHLFKPERFSEGIAKATNNNIAAFFPFGIGPRTCVGLNFATTEAKIALSMILQRYAFTLSPAYVHSPFQLLTIRPQHGVQVMLHLL
ncbi:cytochrome p450 cyp749a22 [Quercus suber]|uniref:Cytochrome p450 cyp749a22 n=1 Tax=Quercus suber TaxID=58331 RepID=A0AAW0KUK1_QUESU